MSGKNQLPYLWTAIDRHLGVTSHGANKARELLSFSIMALISCHYWSLFVTIMTNYFQNAPLPNTITLEVRILSFTFEYDIPYGFFINTLSQTGYLWTEFIC